MAVRAKAPHPPQPTTARTPEEMLQLAQLTFKTASEAQALLIEDLTKTVQASSEALREALAAFQDATNFLREMNTRTEQTESRLIAATNGLLRATLSLKELPPGSPRL